MNRKKVKQGIVTLEKFRAFTKDSTLTNEGALRLGRKVNKSVSKKYAKSFSEITKPLREAKKKINEEDVVDLIHRMRKEKNEQNT